MAKFIAVDGEAFTVYEHDKYKREHRYVLLAASNGAQVYDHQGLSTEACFEFLLDLPKATLVGFGWDYDVNMILRDLDLESLIKLWKTGSTLWGNYFIEWIPSKWFMVATSKKRKVRVNEVFGFFQTSFVRALEAWGIDPGPDMEVMKKKRSLFDPRMRNDIITYCHNECRSLVTLMNKLDDALKGADLTVKSWIGAGAIASALMKRERVKDHHQHDARYPEEVYDAIYRAYYGGRVEVFRQGIFPRVWDYDLVSAYPAVATTLPSLTGGKWKRASSYDPDQPYALWRIRWDVDFRRVLMPFPFREKGAISYPSRGQGWYHAAEVKAALQLHPDLEVLDGWVFYPATTTKPFGFIPEIFRHRRELKAQGNAAEKVLKLGLNSLYGKLAQGQGYQGKAPAYQSLFWAGMITAGTRAKVLQVGAVDPKHLIMVATDGIFFDKPLKETPFPEGTDLGNLEKSHMVDVFVAQSGIYQARVDGQYIGRSRGFFSKEIDYEDLRQGWLDSGPYYQGSYWSERFCGLGSSFMTRHLSDWRTWKRTKRKLDLYPARKFIIEDRGLVIPHWPPALDADKVSEPYRPKKGNVPLTASELADWVEYVQGTEQPLREF